MCAINKRDNFWYCYRHFQIVRPKFDGVPLAASESVKISLELQKQHFNLKNCVRLAQKPAADVSVLWVLCQPITCQMHHNAPCIPEYHISFLSHSNPGSVASNICSSALFSLLSFFPSLPSTHLYTHRIIPQHNEIYIIIIMNAKCAS